jgi:hypothetical protein
MLERYCLHCQVFGEARQEMRVDTGLAELWNNPFTKQTMKKWTAVCPRCKSVEYFFG